MQIMQSPVNSKFADVNLADGGLQVGLEAG